jgi:ABC-type Fe3+/spermidine/putrescine transport system ATPase subunit
LLRIKAVKRLRDYTLDVDIGSNGGTVILMGNNGSGKTTVLNMAAGISRPDSGIIEARGEKMYDSGPGVDIPMEDRNVGYVFQSYALFPHMSVYDNVAFGPRVRKTPDFEERVRAELEEVGMWELRDAKAVRLSGGQKQKVALARCLANKASLLLMDEPLSALDIEMQALMRSYIKRRIAEEKVPAVIVTHSLLDAMELGDRVFVLDTGKVVAGGVPEAILKKGSNKFIDNFFM